MAQVDFYLLNTLKNEYDRDHFICRLIEKIHRQRHTIYIHCKDRQETHKLDELLWTFSDMSFIPHCLYGESQDSPPPIQLGFDSTPPKRDVLINLSSTVPMFYAAFHRILEVVSPQEEQQVISREHYQFYKSQHLEIKMHKIG